jgi:Uma2 family endonuclease
MTTAPIFPQAEPWTLDDLDRLPDGPRYEILDGSLIVSPPPTPRHQLAVLRLAMLLEMAAPEDLQVVADSGVDIAPSYFQPDVAVAHVDAVHAGGKAFRTAEVVLAVEVVSPTSTSRDRLVKPAKYAANGIPHFWRVELDGPGTPCIVRYRLDGDAYVEIGTVCADEEATVGEPFQLTLRPAELTSRRKPRY